MKPITHPLAIAFLEVAAADFKMNTAFSRESVAAHNAWESAGYPLYADLPADPPPNTVRVRVAVSVDADGAWAAWGERGVSDEYAIEESSFVPGDRLTWLTADVPKPEPAAEIVAEVEE